MHIHGGARKLFKRLRKDCSKCRLMEKRTIELEMSKHHPDRFLFSPPYYSVEIDIVYMNDARAFLNSKKKIRICHLRACRSLYCDFRC